jgi:hypothetical protein
MKKICSIILLYTFLSSCTPDNPTPPNNQTTYSGKYTGDVVITAGGSNSQYGMVIDLSSRNSPNEFNFLFGNRQSIMILNGNNFTIPRVQGAPSFIVYGSGYFLDSGKIYIDYTEEVQPGSSQRFRGTLKKF